MITNFDDFCTEMYCVIADLWTPVAAQHRRPGPEPKCSDEELVAMAIIGECYGWDTETVLISRWHDHRDLFPHIPERTRFSRRRRYLAGAINALRHEVVRRLDVTRAAAWITDSLPVPALSFPYAVSASPEWRAHGATYGRVSSKCQTIFGYKLHTLVTLDGILIDFDLAPANLGDITLAPEVLGAHTAMRVLADKAYHSAPLAFRLNQENRIELLTPPKGTKETTPEQRLYNGLRQMIETVNGQLADQFHVERNHAHTFVGLCSRLYTKLAAHTLCQYLNALKGRLAFRQIKRLVDPPRKPLN